MQTVAAVAFNASAEVAKEETLLWVTFSSSSYKELLLNWVAHVKELQVGTYRL